MTPAAVTASVLGYIAVLFAVAWASGRRADNAGFFTGNRRTPWYMAAFAMIGAAMSGVTFISVPGSVAADSFSYMQMVAGFTVGQLIVAFVLIPTFYRLRVVSLYEYLDNRFGVKSHRTGAWFFFISKMLGAALRVYVVCAVMQLLVFSHYGFPFWGNALVTMFFVWLYTRQGGVKSLIWTDTLKTFCLVASLVLSIVFIMRGLGLSFADTAREVSASPMSRIFFFDDPASGRYFWKMFAAGIVLLVAMTGLDQDMMQRNLSCATPRDSQKNIVLTAVSQIFVIFLFLVLGVLLYLYMERSGIAAYRWHSVCCRTYFKYLFSCRVGPHGSHDLFHGGYARRHETLWRRTPHAHPPRGPRGDGARDGRRDPGLRVLGRRQRHQSGLQGRQLYLRSDSGHVRLRDVHASEGPRPLDAAGGPRGPGIECAGAVVGAEDLGLSDWLRTVDLQCRLYGDRHAVACETP